MVEFDRIRTVSALLALVAVGTGGLLVAPIGMTTRTVLMMVLPSMLAFGVVCVALGVKHGEYRVGASKAAGSD